MSDVATKSTIVIEVSFVPTLAVGSCSLKPPNPMERGVFAAQKNKRPRPTEREDQCQFQCFLADGQLRIALSGGPPFRPRAVSKGQRKMRSMMSQSALRPIRRRSQTTNKPGIGLRHLSAMKIQACWRPPCCLRPVSYTHPTLATNHPMYP